MIDKCITFGVLRQGRKSHIHIEGFFNALYNTPVLLFICGNTGPCLSNRKWRTGFFMPLLQQLNKINGTYY